MAQKETAIAGTQDQEAISEFHSTGAGSYFLIFSNLLPQGSSTKNTFKAGSDPESDFPLVTKG